MKKMIVIGCPGSGKTTFAVKLNEITGLPLYHPDAVWHNPDKTHISREEFDAIKIFPETSLPKIYELIDRCLLLFNQFCSCGTAHR